MKILFTFFIMTLCACSAMQTNKPNAQLYNDLGKEEGIAQLTDAFLEQIQYDKRVLPFFLETDIERFRTKFIEQICMISGGPCQYTGDSMADVHSGMSITEHDFNALVNDLISAMESMHLPTATQNQLLHKLAPMRHDIIYR